MRHLKRIIIALYIHDASLSLLIKFKTNTYTYLVGNILMWGQSLSLYEGQSLGVCALSLP